MSFKDGKMVDDFAMCINALVGNMCTLDENISDARVVKKM